MAAILIEPVQGEAGFIPVPQRFLETIRGLCDTHGIVMIADEVQCGCRRTGRFFAFEHTNVVPDLVTLGKSLGAGLSISAVVGRADVMDSVHLGGVGGTYGGNPIASVSAIKAVKMIREPAFLERVVEIGHIMQTEMNTWHGRSPLVGDTLGLGVMRLLEFVLDQTSKEPAPQHTLEVVKHAAARGLISIRAGLYSNGVRLMPPLTLTNDELHEGLAILGVALPG